MGAGCSVAMQVLMKRVTDRKRSGEDKQNGKQGRQCCFAVQTGAGDWSLLMHELVQSSIRMGRTQRFLRSPWP